MSDSKLLRIEEIAERMRVSRRTIDRWRQAGMPYVQPGGPNGRVLFDPDEVERWADGRTDAEPAEEPSDAPAEKGAA